MKKIVFAVFIMYSLNISAQHFSDMLSFADFRNWAENIELEGFVFDNAEQEGDAAYNERVSYSAGFFKGQSSSLSITLNEITEFEMYKGYANQNNGSVFSHGNYEMIYVPREAKISSGWLIVKIPELYAALQIMVAPRPDQSRMISYFEAFDISGLSGSSSVQQAIAWPDEIPVNARLDCRTIKIEKKPASTDGFAYEYHVTAPMGSELINAIQNIIDSFGGSLTNIPIDDSFIFICSEAEDLESLQDYKNENDPVSFIYYKNE